MSSSSQMLRGAMLGALLLAACGNAAGNAPLTEPAEISAAEDGVAAPTPTSHPMDANKLLSPNQEPPRGAAGQFSTDFSTHSVDYEEILSGGPPKDGIPAINNPQFISIAEAEEWLEDVEPVILYVNGEEARAYPIQILIWHEIANDTVGGEPVLITFCPLCNTAIAFKRTVNGQVLDFGTTGRLRYSNLIMYDRQTETWWQQATGQAIAGALTCTQLEFENAPIISWKQFKENYPDGTVMSRETGHLRPYGENPYVGYDDVNQPPFLYFGPETPGVLSPVARVLAVDLSGEAVAYPYDLLAEVGVVNDTVGGVDLVVFWEAGTASALDRAIIPSGRDVGTAAAYSRVLNGETLTFRYVDGRIVDDQTASEWNALGRAVSGPLAGAQLEAVVAVNHFWFSWAAFRPGTEVWSVGD